MEPLLADALRIALVGVLVVFVALSLVTLVLAGLDRARPHLERLEGAFGGEGEGRARAVVVEPPTGPSPEALAVIAAAVAVELGPAARVRRIRYVVRPPSAGWVMGGRVSAMASRQAKR